MLQSINSTAIIFFSNLIYAFTNLHITSKYYEQEFIDFLYNQNLEGV